MTIRLTFHDGYWYVDVRTTSRTAFKSYARCPLLGDALKKAEQAAKGEGHAQP